MEKMIAFCGIECTVCPAFIAYKTDDNELRKKLLRIGPKHLTRISLPKLSIVLVVSRQPALR